MAISYAGLEWKTVKENTSKISSYDATKGQTLRQCIQAYIRNQIRHQTTSIYNTHTGTPKLFQINAIEQQGIKAMSLWYNFYIGIMIALTGVLATHCVCADLAK
jgi:hypothetical protein